MVQVHLGGPPLADMMVSKNLSLRFALLIPIAYTVGANQNLNQPQQRSGPMPTKRRDELPCTQFGYKADPAKMPPEKPVWKMTAEEFAAKPPSRAWFNWFGWPEGHHYCHDSYGYALRTGYECCIKKAIRDGLLTVGAN